MIIISLTISLSLMFLIHPLSFGMILLIQTIMTALITGLMTPNFWFSYILFLIMIGGMLVLFIYMTSIASNEKFNFSIKLTLLFSMMIPTSIMINYLMDKFIMNKTNFNSSLFENSSKMLINKFINFPSNMILYLMIIYLFITLIAVVKITNLNSGPLRKMN
uniref:NADH-ubiquinone oxidoreductase chain 6 n=1 Tax=Staphylinoidea sp. 7 KM-2017 TaxID=2219461 RepID=A0A346RI71_9COLE|nr:NADH dehydrogenase subunit 6 [Staphylinoidea sp. 7 KM-2017]